MKNEFPYRTGRYVFLETLLTGENAEFIEFQSLEDSRNYGPMHGRPIAIRSSGRMGKRICGHVDSLIEQETSSFM
jgi:hypothetical protein